MKFKERADVCAVADRVAILENLAYADFVLGNWPT